MLVFLLSLLIFVLFPETCSGFDIRSAEVSVGTTTINTLTTYTITITRQISPTGEVTAWDAPMKSTDSIIIQFPNQYTLQSTYACTSTIETAGGSRACSNACNLVPTTKNLAVAGCFDTNTSAVKRITVVIENVLNPTPAMTTGSIYATIGADSTVAGSDATVSLSPDLLQCKITFSPPAYFNKSQTMVITMTTKNAIPAGGGVKVAFPTQNYWTGDLGLQPFGIVSTIGCSSPCSGDVANRIVTLSQIPSTAAGAQFTIQISNIISPPTPTNTDQLRISTTDGTYSIDSCSGSVEGLSPNPLTATITQAASQIVNKPVSLTFSITVGDGVSNTVSSYQLVFPPEIHLSSQVSLIGLYVGINPNIQVTGNTVSFVLSSQYNLLLGAVVSFTVQTVTLPPSVAPRTIQVSILRNARPVQTGVATLTALPSALTFTVTPVIETVNTLTAYVFTITLPDPISSTGMIRIVFPLSIGLTISANCASLQGTNVQASGTCVSNASQTLWITNFGVDSKTIDAQTLILTVNGITNPGTSAPTQSIQIKTCYTSSDITDVSVGSGGSITAKPRVINPSDIQIKASDYTVKKTAVTYTVQFINPDPIPQFGSILLAFPPQILPTGAISSIEGNCYFAVGSQTLTSTACTAQLLSSQINVNFTSLFASQSVPINSQIILEIRSSFTNPPSTQSVSPFNISIYGPQNYIINTVSSPLSIKMTTPARFATLIGSQSPLMNSAPATYTFVMNQLSAMDASSKIKLQFPATITFGQDAQCSDGSSNPLTCTKSSQTITVTLPTSVPANTDFTLRITLIKNSYSFQPNDPIIITTFTPDEVERYSTDSSTLIITNNVPSSFASITSTFNPRTYGSATQLSLILAPTYQQSIGSIVIYLAQDFGRSNLACSGWSGVTDGVCTSSSNVINITASSFVSVGNIGVTISGITSIKGVTTQTTNVSIFSSTGFMIDSVNNILFTSFCTLPCQTCPSNNVAFCTSCYTDIQISPSIYYDSINHNCYETCLNGFYKDDSLKLCSPCSGNCLTCVGSATNCSSCDATTTTKFLYNNSNLYSCQSGCPLKYYPYTNEATSESSCKPCSSPCDTCLNSSACLSCVTGMGYKFWGANFSCLFSCPLGDIAIDTGTVCQPCDSVCKTCRGTQSTCIQCADDAAFYQNTCLAACPDGMVINNKSCGGCSSNCQLCSIRATNCTKCFASSSFPLLQKDPSSTESSCVSNCLPKYYNSSSSGSCQLCSVYIGTSRCQDCFYLANQSRVACSSSCIAPYVYYQLNYSCLAVVPYGYVNISGVAYKCTNGCETCSTTTTQCTTCNSSQSLYNQKCYTTCPAYTLSINSVCEPCLPPCANCSVFQTSCLSCLTNLTQPHFLDGDTCGTTCPSTTFSNMTSRVCQKCMNNCTTCDSSSVCLTCTIGTYLFNGICRDVCPNGYIGIGIVCEQCLSPCKTCSGTTKTCQSCDSGYYYTPSSQSCNQTCPQGLYPNAENMSCVGCQSPCQTCNTIPTNCTTCLSGSFLRNRCYDKCPDSYYASEGQCVGCPQICATCSSKFICQSCVGGYYSYLSSCLGSCPSQAPVISDNGSCKGCSTVNCAECTSRDSCYLCQGTQLVYSNQCVDECPPNYESNSTFCILTKSAQAVNQSLSMNGLIPVPFTIGSVLVIIVCVFAKFSYSPMFFTGAAYSIIGLIEPVVHGYFIYLLYQSIHSLNLTVLLSIAALGSLYLVNLISIVLNSLVFSKDMKFKAWYKTRTGCTSYVVFAILSVLFSFKVMNIIFSSLFNAGIFKAKLQHHSRLYYLHLMSFLGLIHSVWAIVMASISLFRGQSVASMLFFISIDLIVVSLLEIVLGVFNAKKQQGFFEEETKGRPTGTAEESDSMNQLEQPLGFTYQKGTKGKYQVSGKPEITEREDSISSNPFSEDMNEGLRGAPQNLRVKPKANQSKNSYEQLSERSQVTDSERNILPEKSAHMVYREVDKTYNNESVGEILRTRQGRSGDGSLENEKDEVTPSTRKLLTQRQKDQKEPLTTITKPNKDRSVNELMPDSFMSKTNSNNLIDSIAPSEQFSPIQDSPMDPKVLQLRSSKTLKYPSRELEKEPSVEQDGKEPGLNPPNVQVMKEEQGEEGDEEEENKKEDRKGQKMNTSGMSEQGRENMMRLKLEMENRQIKQHSEQEESMEQDGRKNPNKGKLPNGQQINQSEDLNESEKPYSEIEQISQESQRSGEVEYRRNKPKLPHSNNTNPPIDERDKSQEMKDDSVDELEESKDRANKAQLRMVQQGIMNPFKKVSPSLQQSGTLFNSNQLQQLTSIEMKKGNNSTRGGNNQSMEKSADEGDEDIVKYPAYIKYGKMYETSEPFLSNYRSVDNQNFSNLTKREEKRQRGGVEEGNHLFERYPVEKEEEEVREDSSDFPDQLSKELNRYQSQLREERPQRPETGRRQSASKKTIRPPRPMFSAGNTNRMVFLRPTAPPQKQAETLRSQHPISLKTEHNTLDFNRQKSLQRLPQNPQSRTLQSDGLLRRPNYSADKSSRSKPKVNESVDARNKELEKIYLGKNYRQEYLNV